MNILFTAILEWLDALSGLEWVGIIALLIVLIGIVIEAFKEATIKINNYECLPLQKHKAGDGFMPVEKDVKDLLPGECSIVGNTGSCVVGRTSIKRRHENNNIWG